MAADAIVFLYMNTETEVNIENVKSEICTGCDAGTFFHRIGLLRLFVDFHAKHSERHVEADILHHKYAETWTEVLTCFSDVCACDAWLGII